MNQAAKIAPRPVDGYLRPIVHCATAKYNMRTRMGRGFTVEELKEAGIPVKFAPTIGIAVDYRRKNVSVESMEVNVQRLKDYKSKLILFPRKAGKPLKGDSTEEEIESATQYKEKLLPMTKDTHEVQVEKIKDEDKKFSAYRTLRLERTNQKYKGIRDKRAAEKAAEQADKKK